MFEDMLIDERIRTKRGKTTILSFTLQALLVSVLVLLPLVFTEALPTRMLETTLVAPPPPPPPPPPAAAASAAPRKVEDTQVKSELEVPVRIPQKVAMLRESMPNAEAGSAPPSTGAVVGGVSGGVEGGTIGGVMGGVLNSVGSAIPKLAAPNRVKVSSGVTQGLLMHQVKPEYPPVARNSRVEGTVVLAAVVGKDGKVKDVRVISGQPMLAQAAERAVRQWKYKPYMLNGQPVEIDTTINVNFKLGA
jgi:protein TonB